MSTPSEMPGNDFCSECGFRRGDARFCPSCGSKQTVDTAREEETRFTQQTVHSTHSQIPYSANTYPPTMEQNWSSQAPILNIHVTERRVAAAAIDLLGILIIGSILGGILGGLLAFPFGPGNTADVILGGVTLLFLFLLALADYQILQGLTGQTVGKKLLGIRVVKDDGSGIPGMVDTFLRWIIFCFEGGLLGLIIIAFSSKKQRLGDMAAGTLVVRT